MKIDLQSIDQESFMVHQHVVNGEVLHLVQPQHVGCKWNQNNKIFRSSLWNNDGELVSACFPKFTNYGENPDHFPVPTSLKNTHVVEKLDGSLLSATRYFGNYIIRTRGTVDAAKLDNGHEVEVFKNTILHPKIGNYANSFAHWVDEFTWPCSILFEWTSPNQRIILNYGDAPAWSLIGVINHDDYSLWLQPDLDAVANKCGLQRPISYTFPSVEELLANVDELKGKEGVVIYSHNGQTMHKCKSLEYIAKHRFKSQATLENTVDIYFSMGKPSYQDFEKNLIEAFDYECFEMVRGFISIICDAYKEVRKIENGFDVFIEHSLKSLPTRKDQAQKVLASYGTTNRASFIFSKLDGKSLDDEQLKKLLWQVLKK